MPQADEQEQHEEQPVELDAEAAADTAAPADIEPPRTPQKKITPQQMWDWLYDETQERMATLEAFRRAGGDTRKLESQVQMLTGLANSVAFIIDNEADIREYIKGKRQAEEIRAKRGARR